MSSEVEMVKPSLKDNGSETMPLTTNYGGLSSGMREFCERAYVMAGSQMPESCPCATQDAASSMYSHPIT